MTRKLVAVLMLLVLVLNLAVLVSNVQPVKALGTKYSWSMFRHDLTHSGYTESPMPGTNNKLWNYTTGSGVYSSPAVADGRVYVGSYDNRTYCLNASTGAQIWNYTTGNWVFSSPAVADGRVYVGSFDDRVYCLDALTGAQVWNYKTGKNVYSSPAVVDGRVYVGSWDNRTYCLDALTGAQLWNFTTGNYVYSSPAVVDGRVYVGSYDNRTYCLDALTGAQVWNYTTDNWVYSSPAVVDGRVYVGSWDNRTYCLDASTGAQIWNYTTGSYVFSSPAVVGGMVYVGSSDYRVYCLNASTGGQLWNYLTGNGVFSSPAAADGVLYVGSEDGSVYAFGTVLRVPEDYPTIQGAINAAAPGATVWVDPGVYYESIVINKTVTLLGKIGSPPPVFQGGGSGIAINITAAGSGSTVADFAISNWAQGILLNDASTCKIYDNIMSQMSSGGLVVQGGASQNNIYGNTINESAVGINVTGSNNNMIYNNNFIGNIVQLSISASTGTVLDNGFPAGGNFWSDYKQKYPTAQEIDSSGIWNTAYAIDKNNNDHYPLKIPYGYKNNPIPGDVNGDAKVDMGDIVALCDAFGSKPGKLSWNANCDLDKDGKITMGDIVIGLDHFGQHYP
jgi:parallel beta-helix repeat protein